MPVRSPEYNVIGPFARWGTILLGLLMVALGLIIAAGGAWLLSLGGSFYYLVAGLGLLFGGVFIMRGQMLGAIIYGVTYLFTLVWALWEVGFDGWAQVPRLVAPTVILLLVLIAMPALRRREEGRRGGRAIPAAAMTLLLAAGTSVVLLPWLTPVEVIAQGGPGATQEETEPENGLAQPLPMRPAPGAIAASETAGAAGGERQALPLAEVGADWPVWGGSLHATRYSPLDQITTENVGELVRAWEYRTGDMPTEAAEGKYSPENTPLKVGNMLFVCSAMGIAIGVDAATGKEEWRFDPEVSEDSIPYGATCRGVAYFAVPDAGPDELCATRVIWGTLDARLIAVDAVTGQLCTEFGSDGMVNLENGIGETVPGWYAVTSAPTIVRGVVVVGAQVSDGNAEDSPSGVIRGYDATTGEFVWAWDMGRPGEYGEPPEGEVYTRGTPNMWTTAAGDEELGHVYLPMGNSAVDYYGSNRSEEENTYSTALVALDVNTGAPVWHFQTVYNDVWDYDLGSQPTLVDFPVDGGTVPALVLASKQGDIYILDRRTGESLFAVEEREVPQGGVEPDYLSPTQPFSTYHTLAFPPLEEKDMWGMSPLDQLWCRIRFQQAHYEGIYTPPTTDTHWIQYPGYNGGNDWGSVAVDTERGLIIANYSDMPNHNRLLPREEVDRLGVVPIYATEQNPDAPQDIAPQAGAPFGIDVNAGWRIEFTGLLCKEPPYGGIRAIDLATGETVWDRPLGTARANGPFRLPTFLPFDIGTPNNGGPVVTAGGLIFIAAATDNLIRAIDIETGETLWSDVLPAGGQANPIVMEAGGREFLVIGAGGHHFMETPIGDYVIAYALPEAG